MPKRLLRNLARILRLQRAIERFGLFRKAERENLAFVLAQNIDGFARPELKLKVYEAILGLRREIRRRFGLLVVLGWEKEWNERYSSMPDSTQNIFSGRHTDVAQCSMRQLADAPQKNR